MQYDNAFTAGDIPSKPHNGDVAQVLPYSFLKSNSPAATEQHAASDSSRVIQEDLMLSVNSDSLVDANSDPRNEDFLTTDDLSRQFAACLTSHSGFHDANRGNNEDHTSSYPTSNSIQTASKDLSDHQQLAHSTSHVTHHWNPDLLIHTNNNSHTADGHYSSSSIADLATHTGTTSATNTTIFKKKRHPHNWVNFEDDDYNVRGTRTSLSDYPATAGFHNHMTTTSDQHVISSYIDSQLTDNARDTADSSWTTLDSKRESNELTTDALCDIELVINAASLKTDRKRASAPICLQRKPSDGDQWRSHVAYPESYHETPHSVISEHNGVTDEDTSLLQQQTLFPARLHSVDTSVHVSNKVYETTTTNPLDATRTAHQRRTQFAMSHSHSEYSSLPEDWNLQTLVKDASGSKRNNVTQNIFRTSSSVSLHSDSSINTTPLTVSSHPLEVPSHDPWKKALKWVSVILDRKGTSAPMPIDDSMEFGLQHSPSNKQQVTNADSKAVKQSQGSQQQNSKHVQQLTDTIVERSYQDGDTKPETRTAVYKKRWYLLFLFSMSAMLWNAVWSTWGPIAQSAKDVYDWTDSDIAMFIWLGNIPFLLTMFPCSYLMDVKGMRIAMIVACGFMFLGTGFRCIPSDVTTATWLIRTGQFLNGMAGTIPNSAPALLSALWFPPSQRASATAISTVAGYMGASVSFVIGPLLVSQPDDLLPVNSTDDDFSVYDFLDTNNNTNNVTSYDAQKNGIMHILYGECAVAGLLFVLVLIYFPSKPPLPPSVSASIPREKYIPGLKMLVRNKQFWVCAIAFSVPAGVYEAWQVILDVILDDKGVSQQTAGWLDFYATVGGCVSGLLVSRFADFFTRQMKLFLLIFYFFAAVSILWFTLVVFDILPFDRVSMYAAIIIAGVFLDGGGPLFFELTIEVSYPVGEGVTSGFTQMLCAAAGICFLSVVQVESLGKQWINWYFFGCVAMAIPLLFFITTTYGRADVDDLEEEGEGSDDDSPSPGTDEKTYLFGSSHV